MKSLTCHALIAVGAGLILAASAHAQTLRWSSQGDLQTMDPDSRNESLTNSLNGQVYEFLTGRDKQLNIVPQLATEWQQTGPLQWRMKLRPNVKFHDGTPFSADDVVFSIKRAQDKASDIRVYANAMGEPKKLDNLSVEFNLKEVDPIFLQHANAIYIMSKAWCEKNNVTRPGLQRRRAELCRAERERHRAVHAGLAPAGREDGLQAQPELVGQVRGQRAGRDLHAGQEQLDPRGGADLRRARLHPRPASDRHAAPAQHAEREGHRRPGEPHHLHRHGPGA